MNFFYTLIIFFALSHSLHAMIKPGGSLNSIEKALVLREIYIHGLATIAKQVEESTSPKLTANIPKIPIILRIRDTFLKPEVADTDPLTTAIFNKINEVELKNGYNPSSIELVNGHYCHTHPSTNYLGNHTRYYWEKNNETIRIESHITNKKDLLEIVNHEKTRLTNAVNKKIIS
jgi:hypothetical protein